MAAKPYPKDGIGRLDRLFHLWPLFIGFGIVHWNPSIVDFFVKAKLSTIEGFSTNEGVLCGEKSICQA